MYLDTLMHFIDTYITKLFATHELVWSQQENSDCWNQACSGSSQHYLPYVVPYILDAVT